MLFGQDRDQLRRFFCEVWRKHLGGEALEPLESLIAQVIAQHPEYHALLTDPERALERDWLPEMGETNPFLHMGMHIAIQEQLGVQRPAGILEVYQALCRRVGDAHEAEHRMMEALGETLWEASRSGLAPDEQRYLRRLRRLAGLP
ncbi:MAG TPA: DUF1841 family protein [Candidatus Competibacteraceae bacterium]|nr:DUF1841 family protein [Candidatus Competibacteraceae bacterium]